MPMTYGDLSPRVGKLAWAKLLKRALAMTFLRRFCSIIPLPKNKGKTVIARRYNRFAALALTALQEGVTPDESEITYADVQCVLEQFGRLVKLTDVVADTHEDPVLNEFSDILAEDMAETMETLDYYIMRGGTSIYYANGTARTDVNTPIALADLKIVERALLDAKARYMTEILDGKAMDGTLPIPASFIVFGHTNLKSDLENITGWTAVHEYSSPGSRVHEYEVGSVGNFRFVLSPLFVPFADGGGAYAGSGTAMLTTSGTSADVYPLIVISDKRCVGLTNFSGNKNVGTVESSGRVAVINPDTVDKSDPLGQRGFLSYKFYHSGMILDDTIMARIEVAATATPS